MESGGRTLSPILQIGKNKGPSLSPHCSHSRFTKLTSPASVQHCPGLHSFLFCLQGNPPLSTLETNLHWRAQCLGERRDKSWWRHLGWEGMGFYKGTATEKTHEKEKGHEGHAEPNHSCSSPTTLPPVTSAFSEPQWLPVLGTGEGNTSVTGMFLC